MWKFKPFFFFSYGQRIAIVVLLILIAIGMALNVVLPRWIEPPSVVDDSTFLAQVDIFEQSLEKRSYDYQIATTWDNKSTPRKEYHASVPTYFPFDPNTLDSAGFVRLGLKPFIARNIINYRSKGGQFRIIDDLAKIYGITSDQFAQLKPYIVIGESFNAEFQKLRRDSIIAEKKRATEVYVDLNNADTSELQQLWGIGSVLARQIVAYRDKLGGFSTTEQLLEVNLPQETFDRISPFLSVDTTKIIKIAVNRATVERLRKHPYINFYQAKAIYELRRTKEALDEINELSVIEEFTSEELERLRPYLDFSKIKREYRSR